MAERPSVGLPQICLGPHAVARWAAEQPDVVAIRAVEGDGDALTYAALDEKAHRWASALESLGVARGTHVATLLPNGPDAHAAWLGLGWLCAVEIPLNTALRGPLLEHALRASDAEIVIATRELADRIAELASDGIERPGLPALRVALLVDAPSDAGLSRATGLEVVDLRPAVVDAKRVEREGPTYRDVGTILFTSGTTGPAKPVLVPWAVVYQFYSWVPDDVLLPGEALYCAMAMFHNSGRCSLNACLVRGGTFVYRERFSGERFWSDVREHECRLASLAGPMTALLHAAPARPDDAENPLRGVACGPMIPDIEGFEQRFGLRAATGYGQTEVGMATVTGWEHGPWECCGRAREDYPWSEIRVVDEHDEPLGPGEVGELVVRSAEPWALNVGYYGMPDATAKAWRNGWFHTGDAFRYDEDGWFYLVDRMSDAIRRRGENISSYEVESIVSAHPDVAECAAVAAPAELGEDEVRVVVIAREGAAVDPAALLAWLEPRTPRYMLPRYVDVVDDLPRNTTTGRIKKHELRAQGIGPATWDREAHGR